MGILYVVPTPIGNLEDITFRAISVLKSVDLILAEDTRTSSFLLKKYEITTPMESHHKFNEHKTSSRICDKLAAGANIALISDAGTPGISDPGFYLVRACVDAGIKVETLPGATAFVPALVNSALPSTSFIFEGFLPIKKGRQTKLKELATQVATMILYESPYRLVKTLRQLAEYLGEGRRASVSREISKMFEETKRGTLLELADYYQAHEPKGEIVIIVEGGDYAQKREDRQEAN